MPTEHPFDFWVSEELKKHAIQQPHEQLPTHRNLDKAQVAEFQAELEASTSRVKASGRFSFKCGMGVDRARLPPGEERVERSYWFEMPGSTWADPLYTIVHVHFSGLWRCYVEDPSDKSAGSITQINVRHFCGCPRLKYEDEKFYGIASDAKGIGSTYARLQNVSP